MILQREELLKGNLVKIRYNIKDSLWCNGSTTDFDSVSFGSSPDGETKIKK